MNAAAGEEGAQAAEPVTPGELLRRERERRRLSIQQAAEDMHLDAWIVEAIEENRFVALGAPVYAKGHLRKYATQLGLAPELVIARYVALSDVPVEPTPIPTSVNAPPRTERISLKTPLLVAALLIAAAVAWWIVNLLTTSASPVVTAPAGAPTVPQVEDSQPAPTVAPQSPLEPRHAQQTVVEPDGPAPAAPAAHTPAVAAPASNGPVVRLRLEFSDASWAEVYDADGDRLMFDLGAPGRVRTLSGTPPLRVTLGAASAVSAQVNDEPIVIPRRAGRDASKFVIDAAGGVTPGSGR
jgi:cytoskeleton protein RodZ